MIPEGRTATHHCAILNGTLFNNGTTETSETVYVPLILYPVLLIVCTVGNIINVLVLSRFTKIRIKEVLLIGLAVSDTFIMWLALPRYIDHHGGVFGLHDKPDYPLFLLNGFGFFTWMHYTFYYVSDWVLLIFSLERLMAFRYPHHHRRIRSRLNWTALLLVAVTVLSSLLCLEHLVWYYHWLPNREQDSYEAPLWLTNWDAMQTRADIVFPVLTAACLLVINTSLLVYLKRRLLFSASFRRSTLSPKPSTALPPDGPAPTARHWLRNRPIAEEASQIGPNINMDVLLLGCVALYFLTQFPAVIFNVFEYLSGPPHCQLSDGGRSVLRWLQPIVQTLSLVNYSANFLVYAGLNRKYRQLSLELLCGRGKGYHSELNRWNSNPTTPDQAEMPLLRLSLMQRLSGSFFDSARSGGVGGTERRGTLSTMLSNDSAQSHHFMGTANNRQARSLV
ncbi:hypothetical protein BV898_03481 [Hypsibius exemplaris]|uniref:G-protein coupled receptors family 1 profile domain-containing protein n=1 Tax=Hypsibius exemplaris TaxID=2072580 RepID=A0A1W0X551_HYPEX|nr:hypothetical protein BV898_03481 [Hypsibius exemplaris]